MKKLCAGFTAGLMLAAAAWVGGTGAALADYRSDRAVLCGPSAPDKCTIDIRDDLWELVEGKDKATVDVVGNPNVSTSLQMYALDVDSSTATLLSIRSYGSPVDFTTDASGKATVMIPVTRLTAPHGAGTLIAFQLVGSTLVSTRDQPIIPAAYPDSGEPDMVYVRSARGGDDNALTKVTDGVLRARVAGGLTGDVYGVQLKLDGKWTDITDRGVAGNGKIDADGFAVVFANVAGYPDGEYEMRMFNRTRGIYDLALRDFQGTLTLEKNIYITPGEHLKNGRKWRTTCEAYSQTQRCRTEIWSSEVVYKAGKLVKNNGWHFNNLTYKESPKALWKGNPLGNSGKYTINGRQWRTECNTKVTGGNGCRSYIVSDVVQATKKGASYTYKMVRKEVLNNIVLFEIPA